MGTVKKSRDKIAITTRVLFEFAIALLISLSVHQEFKQGDETSVNPTAMFRWTDLLNGDSATC